MTRKQRDNFLERLHALLVNEETRQERWVLAELATKLVRSYGILNALVIENQITEKERTE